MGSCVSAHPASRVTYSQQFRRCNKPGCPTCELGSPGHGPYWYAFWREGGRRRSRYVGKQLPPEAVAEAPSQTTQASDSLYAPLRVRTLGGFAVWRGPARLPDDAWAQRKAATLLKCLLSVPRHRMHRERLADMLGLTDEPVAAATYLRTTIHRLRKILGQRAGGQGYVRLDGDLVSLAPSPDSPSDGDWLDALAFERAAAAALHRGDAAACRKALALYGGEFLPDDLYDEWAVTRREELRQQYVAVLLRLAGLRERDGVLAEAARCLRGILALDPCHETAAQALMRVQLSAGLAPEAVRTYHRLAEALRRDLDMEPDAESETQYRTALASRKEAAARRSNLPTLLTSFLGRERELAALQRLFADEADATGSPTCRLLTLTGAGGCGKTRLAIEFGHELRSAFADGLWMVELGGLTPNNEPDADLVARQAAEAAGVRLDPGLSARQALAAALQSRRVLFILDNCEHMIPASAQFVVTVLQQCPDMRILATSREALGVIGETVWRLSSLSVPRARQGAALAVHELSHYAGVHLLVERARLVAPGFALTLDNCRAVAAICSRLDGIPLAIELAAARLGQISPSALADRLHDRFLLLTAGNRAGLPRHRTLGAIMDWSYELLDDQEKALLRTLSVFAGGFTLEAVEAVCAGGTLKTASISELIARLASKSLLQIDDLPEPSCRYRLLETVRYYAAQRLREQGEEMRARRDQLHWCLDLAERLLPRLDGRDRVLVLEQLEAEHDNLRSALEWSVREGNDWEAGLQLAGALWPFWSARSHWIEGRSWLSAALAWTGGTAAVRLRALHGLGHFAINQGDAAFTRSVYEEYLAIGRAVNNNSAIANALNGLANVARFQGDRETATALYTESLERYQTTGDTTNIARVLHNLALVAQEEGDYARAIRLNEQCLAHRRLLNERHHIGYTLLNQAVCTRLAGDSRRAAALLESVLVRFEELGDVAGSSAAHSELGRICCDNGEFAEAAAHLCASLEGYRALGERLSMAEVLQNWAVMTALCGNPGQAVRLLGAADSARAAIGHALPPGLQRVFEADITLARTLVGSDAVFAAKWAEGQSASLDEVVGEMLTHEVDARA